MISQFKLCQKCQKNLSLSLLSLSFTHEAFYFLSVNVSWFFYPPHIPYTRCVCSSNLLIQPPYSRETPPLLSPPASFTSLAALIFNVTTCLLLLALHLLLPCVYPAPPAAEIRAPASRGNLRWMVNTSRGQERREAPDGAVVSGGSIICSL